MSGARVGLVVGVLLGASGCIYDGAYLVQGTVRSSAGAVALRDAEVVTRDGASGPRQERVTTGEDGTYRAEYRFGGMGFLFFTPGDGDPHVEFAAPGHEARAVQLKAGGAEPGVTRRACEPETLVRCYRLDVVLEPAASSVNRLDPE